MKCSKKVRSALLLGVLAVVLTALAAGQNSDHPIHLPTGKTTASARGFLGKRSQTVFFSLSARAGQRLRVRIVPLASGLRTAAVVIYPSGRQEGGPGGVVFDRELRETGIYRLRVTPRFGRGHGSFRVDVKLDYPQG
jgi:hypothetical protein